MEEKEKRKSPILEIWRRLKERSHRHGVRQEKNPEEKKEKQDSGT